MAIFFGKVQTFSIGAFCVCSDGFQFLTNAIFTTLYNYKLFIFFFEITYWFWKCFSQNSPLCNWSMFSSVDPWLAAGKMCQIYLSLAAFSMILKDHRQLSVCIFRNKIASLGFLKIASVGSFKSVTGRVFKINTSFKKTSKTFACSTIGPNKL